MDGVRTWVGALGLDIERVVQRKESLTMSIPVHPLPLPNTGAFGRLGQKIEWLLQDVSWETLEDLSPREAAAQLTVWTVQWRFLEREMSKDAPGVLYRSFRRVLGLILEATSRYPGKLPRIPALDRNVEVDLDRELVRARDLLVEEAARRSVGGWKDDLLDVARELGIDMAHAPADVGATAPG
jgi:hypothetical protein